MVNRELELVLLQEMQKICPNFEMKPMVDFKHGDEKSLPRIVSRTLSNSVLERYQERIREQEKIIYKQTEVHRHSVSFTFLLSEEESQEDVEKIRKYFSHIVGSEWWIDRSGNELVIEEITDMIDISEYTKDGYIERYSFDMYIRTIEENRRSIEEIKEIHFDVNGEGGKTWQLK